MTNTKLTQLQKLYENGLISETELKSKREEIISEIIDSESGTKTEVLPETKKPKKNIYCVK